MTRLVLLPLLVSSSQLVLKLKQTLVLTRIEGKINDGEKHFGILLMSVDELKFH